MGEAAGTRQEVDVQRQWLVDDVRELCAEPDARDDPAIYPAPPHPPEE
jgi:hypothetical protein